MSSIAEQVLPFSDFLSSKPNLRYLFFGGKGGVGKTVVAAGAAYYLAEKMGKKTLLSSTNPVHSLSNLFGIDIWGKGITKIPNTRNLSAIEMDITRTIEKYKSDIADRMRHFLKYADMPVNIDPFVDIATTNPAFEESAMFDDITNLMLSKEFEAIVFDTAPVAHTYRLLGMSRMYDMWLHKMVRSREETLSLRVKLSFRKEKVMQELKKDPLLGQLLETRKRTEEARKLLTDSESTAFFFVTLPLALPIAVIERFVVWVRAFNIPVGGVIVNSLLPKTLDQQVTSPYVINKIAEQEAYLKTIHEKFPGLVRGHVPSLEGEGVGIEMIAKIADALERRNM